ncbi:MAG TPA: hypothetical protein VJ378_00800, partial [Candidatus Paceibacterota bacterium]|nr:hypothetical protein [Candidatus Paceibacterota bacterium]
MDDNARLGLIIISIILLVAAGVVWACSGESGCGDECNSNAIIINQSQPSQPTPPPVTTEVVKVVEVPVYITPTPTCSTYVNGAVYPKKVYLCRGEGLTFIATVGNVDPDVEFWVDGVLYRTVRNVYDSTSIDFHGYLAPGWH